MNLRVLFAAMLVTTAFSAVAQTEENPENTSIAGLFNGVDLDRLTIYPIESSLVSDGYGGRAYERMLIKSEKGTVPDLVINKEPGIYSLGFGYGDVHMDDLTIYNLRGVFETGAPPATDYWSESIPKALQSARTILISAATVIGL